MKKIIIIGASGHGKVAADIAQKMNKWNEIFFLDDSYMKAECLGFPIIGTSEKITELVGTSDFFVAIGDNEIRKNLLVKLQREKATVVSLIHPSAIIGNGVFIDVGTIITAGVVINPDVTIGKGVIVNTGSTIDHDCKIGNYVHISPGVTISGNVVIGNKTWIGSGSTLVNNIEIYKDTIVGAGSLVRKNIEMSGTYVGNILRRIKQ